MRSKVHELIERMRALQEELSKEYARLAVKYQYSYQKRKIIFLEQIKQKHLILRTNLLRYIFSASFRNILSAPFIYMMIIPSLCLDIFLYIYQKTAFRLYRIPEVKREDYIIYDRQFLSYLNPIEKINCVYCTYVNGLFSYAVEIGARTERYWCPIKAARNPKFTPHSQYSHFADYGDPEAYKKLSSDGGGFQS